MNGQKQLLCVFVNDENYNRVIQDIKNQHDLTDRKIFVFANVRNPKDLYLTFNIVKKTNGYRSKGTISIHRKKQTNTLYTLNAMNRLISDENNGVFDKSFQLNWDLYKDCIILTNDVGVKIVSLKLIRIEST